MKILYPVGGMGQRMSAAGYTLPKPMLMAQDKPLIRWATEMTAPFKGRYEYVWPQETLLQAKPWGIVPPGCWHVLAAPTKSVLATLAELKDCLTEESCLVCDCDSFMNPTELADAVRVFEAVDADAGVTVRKTNEAHCSFVDLGSEWWVKEAREKDPFTSWSSTGPYWFRSGTLLRNLLEKGLSNNLTSVAQLLNYPAKVKAHPISTFIHLGTPEELERFNALA